MPEASAIPYEVGFDVQFQRGALWSAGADVTVSLWTTEPVGEAAVAEYDALATVFFMLANTGGICGHGIPPAGSRIADRDAPHVHGNHISFTFRGCRADDLSTVLCTNALSLGHAAFPLERVVIAGPSTGVPSRLLDYDLSVVDPYPEVFAGLSFPYAIEDDIAAPTLTLRFEQAPSDDVAVELAEHLLTWAAACAGGAYGSVLAPPSDCYMSVSPNDLQVVGTTATLVIQKFRCHEAALRALVNACGALPHSVRIEELTID